MGLRFRFVSPSNMARAIRSGTAQIFHFVDGAREAVLAVYLRRRARQHCVCAALGGSFPPADAFAPLVAKTKEYMSDHVIREIFTYWPQVGQNAKLEGLRTIAQQTGSAFLEESAANDRFIVYRLTFAP
jgi:hypothetical protein